MGLKIKDMKTSLQTMVDHVVFNSSKVNDFTEGSVIRSILEAVATTIEQAYFDMYNNVMWGVENAIYKAFGFEKVEMQHASGFVTLKYAYPLDREHLIPKGTRFTTEQKGSAKVVTFVTAKDHIVRRGSIEADVEVISTVPGTVGNVAKDTIKVMTTALRGVVEVTNRNAFLTGREEESTANRKQRFNRYIETLSKGTKKAIEFGAKEVPEVEGVWVDDSYIGVVHVYIHDSNGNLTEEVKNKVIDNLENYRAAGIPVEVYNVERLDVDMEIEVAVASSHFNEEFRKKLEDSVYNRINNYTVSTSLYLSNIVQYIMNFDSVAIMNCRILTPLEDIEVSPKELIRAGNITVRLVQNF